MGQPCPQTLELGYPVIDPLSPAGGQLLPIGPLGYTVIRQFRQFLSDLFQGKAHSLGEYDKCNAAENRSRIAPMAGPSPLRVNKSAVLIKPQRR